MNFFVKKAYRFYIKLAEIFCKDDIELAKIKYKFKNGVPLNLENPLEFMEKLQWLKFYHYTEDYGKFVDKYEVRDIVKERVGESYLNELLGVYDTVDAIDILQLPNQFALKCTHGSGYNVIVNDKSKINWTTVKNKLKRYMKSNYFELNGESIYQQVTPRIIAEKFLDELAHHSILDYKFYCIHGKPVCIWLKTYDDGAYRSCYYDLEWNRIGPDSNTNSYLSKDIPKPDNLEEMIEVAEKLSRDFIFIRVDLYSIKNKVYFGELTFFPWGGKKRITVEHLNKELGDMINLPLNKMAN